MIKNSIRSIVAAIGIFAIAAGCGDGPERHEAARAIEHVADAIDMYDAKGLADTIAYYDDPASIDGEFYVVIIDADDVILTHPFRPELTGTSADASVTDDGTPVRDAIRSSVVSGGPAWVSYTFVNPANDEVERKHVWVVPHDSYLFVSGYYEPLP